MALETGFLNVCIKTAFVMKPYIFVLLSLLAGLIHACTTFTPHTQPVTRSQNDQMGPTGGLKITWQTDTVTTGSFRLFTEATFTSLNDTHLPLVQRGGIKPVSSGVLQFVIDDLNPGNYVIEIVIFRKGIPGGIGRSSSVQVTAGKQREYNFGNEVAYFPAPPGRLRAEEALKKVMGLYNCNTPTESIYVNQRYPESIEKFNPSEDRVLGFESSFSDTVAVFVDGLLVAKRYMKTSSNGSASQITVKAASGAKISISTTPNDCAEFQLKAGYKYVYINRYPVRKWDIAYSNFSRGYY